MKRCCIFVLSLFLFTLTACSNVNVINSKSSCDTEQESEVGNIVSVEDAIVSEVTESDEVIDEGREWSFEDEDYAIKINIEGVNNDNWYRMSMIDSSDGVYKYEIVGYKGTSVDSSDFSDDFIVEYKDTSVDSFDFSADCEIYMSDKFDGFTTEFLNEQDYIWEYCPLDKLSFGTRSNRPYIWWKEFCDNQSLLKQYGNDYSVHYRVAVNSNLGNENVKFLCIDLHMPIDGIYDNVKDQDVLTSVGDIILRDLKFDEKNEFQGTVDFGDDERAEERRSHYYSVGATRQMILFDESSSSDMYLVYNNFPRGSYIKDFHRIELPKAQYGSWNTIYFTANPFEELSDLSLEPLPFQTITIDSVDYSCYTSRYNLVLISEPFEDCHLVVNMMCLNKWDESLIELAREELLWNFQIYNGSTLVVTD